MNSRHKILFVEDDEATSYIYKYVLGKVKFDGQYEFADNGEDAIKFLVSAKSGKGFIPTLIFLDINMPRMNGFEFLEKLREHKDITDTYPHVFMLTNSLNPDDQTKAADYPEVERFLSKPLKRDILEEILEEFKVD